MRSIRGSVAASWFLVLALLIETGTANVSAHGRASGVDADGRSVTQITGAGSGTHANSELLTIGILAAFAFVTAATALLTVRNHQDQ